MLYWEAFITTAVKEWRLPRKGSWFPWRAVGRFRCLSHCLSHWLFGGKDLCVSITTISIRLLNWWFSFIFLSLFCSPACIICDLFCLMVFFFFLQTKSYFYWSIIYITVLVSGVPQSDLIMYTYNSLCLLISNSQFIPPPWQPQVCSLWICFCFINNFICVIFWIPYISYITCLMVLNRFILFEA